MYYYSNRSRMSASPSAAWPGAGGQQSCCGGGAELRNGNGGGRGGGRGQMTEARAFSDWESATCDSANAAQSTSTRDREDGAELELSRCCRGGDGRAAAADGQDGSVRLPRGTGTTRTAARGVQSADTAISERSACSYSAGLHCGGGSDPDSGTGTGSSDEAASQTRQSRSEPVTHRRRACVSCGASRAAVMEGTGGACNGKRRGCGTAKGRVRLCRVRSFLSYTEVERANGTGSPSVNGGACVGGTGDVTGSRLKQVEAVKRQVRLGERTDMLWRRLHAVQVKQVERHVTQQLVDMRRSPVTPNSAELLRLARSCSEALRTAGGALDSDHTASSSGGGSDTEEEEEEEEEGGRRRGRHDVPSRAEWQWMWERAWLGSRWVWLQAQVSELEYGIRALTELYTHLRQGKCRVSDSTTNMPLGARRSCPGPQDCRKKLAENSPHTAHTASAARVRPLLGPLPGQRRPRLIRLNTCPALGLKVMSRCRCEPPAVCVLCGGPRPPVQDTPPEQRNHPVLSMPSVFPRAACGVAPPMARLQSHNTAKWMDGQGRRRSGGVRRRRRRRILYPSPPGTLLSPSNSSGRSTCRGLRGVASAGLLPQQAADVPHLSGGMSDTQTQPMRRRRGQSSFDINNLVMPLGSVGLQARVQKLQYKQIITPSWRELDSAWEDSEKQMVTEGPHAPQELEAGGAEHSSGVEDLSDAVFLKRHAVWESRERNRWGSRARRRHRGRSSSSCRNGESYRGLEETPSCPELRRRRSSAWCSFHYTADETFHQTLDEQQTVLTWERRSFPLLKEELHWLQDDEEAELEEDVCAASGRSQSTDSGISEGSLELSPRTPLHITYTQEATNQSPLLRTQTPPCFL